MLLIYEKDILISYEISYDRSKNLTTNLYTQPRSIVNSERVSDTIRKFPNSGEAFKYNITVRKKLSVLVDQEISELLEKGAIQKSEPA